MLLCGGCLFFFPSLSLAAFPHHPGAGGAASPGHPSALTGAPGGRSVPGAPVSTRHLLPAESRRVQPFSESRCGEV